MVKEKAWRIAKLRPGENLEFLMIPQTLKALQESVGGYIELIRLRPLDDEGIDVYCDEDGRSKGLTPNCAGLLGNMIFVARNGDEYKSLTRRQVEAVREWAVAAGRAKPRATE